MIVTQFIHLLQMLGLVALQVLLLNHIHLFGYATPMVFVAFLLYFPLNASRIGVLLWGFAMGLVVDIFSNTLGMATASMTLAAMVQQPLLAMMAPRDSAENITANYQTMGRSTHIRFIILLVLVHHTVFYLLESFSFHHPLQLLISFLSGTLLSILLILTLEVFRGKRK